MAEFGFIDKLFIFSTTIFVAKNLINLVLDIADAADSACEIRDLLQDNSEKIEELIKNSKKDEETEAALDENK